MPHSCLYYRNYYLQAGKLEARAGFAPAAFTICNRVHWATLAPRLMGETER
jgi:hypothetical protein